MFSSGKNEVRAYYSPQRAGSFSAASVSTRQAQTHMPLSSWGGGNIQSTCFGRRCGGGGGGGGRCGLFGRCFNGCRGLFGRLFNWGCRRRRDDGGGGDGGDGCNGPGCRRNDGGGGGHDRGEDEAIDGDNESRNIRVRRDNRNNDRGNDESIDRDDPMPPKTPGSEDKTPPNSPRSDDKSPEKPRNEKPKEDKPDGDKKFPQRKGAPSDKDRDRFLEKINALRKKRGLKALEYDDKLNLACERHARDMRSHGNMSHSGSDGSSFMQRMRRAGYKMRGSAAENVAMGSRNADGVFSQWFHSSGHLANMLNRSVTKIGLGKDGVYWSLTLG